MAKNRYSIPDFDKLTQLVETPATKEQVEKTRFVVNTVLCVISALAAVVAAVASVLALVWR